MAPLKAGDSFPEGVSFQYIPPTGNLDLTVCGRPISYDASKGKPRPFPLESLLDVLLQTAWLTNTSRELPEFQTKKIVLVSVPGAFTPTCQEQHITSYLANLAQFKAKGVDGIIFIAFNDPFVMSAWGKANGVKDESIVRFFCLFCSLSALG